MNIIVFSVDTYLQKNKDSMPLEEQLRILLDKMDLANSQKKGGKFAVYMCTYLHVSIQQKKREKEKNQKVKKYQNSDLLKNFWGRKKKNQL